MTKLPELPEHIELYRRGQLVALRTPDDRIILSAGSPIPRMQWWVELPADAQDWLLSVLQTMKADRAADG